MLGLEVPRRGQAANQGWLLLVLGQGPLSKKYGIYRNQMLLISELFRTVQNVREERPFIWKSHCKQLG